MKNNGIISHCGDLEGALCRELLDIVSFVAAAAALCGSATSTDMDVVQCSTAVGEPRALFYT